MFGRDAVEAGHKLVDARVVFHGAGTKRVHAEIDGVVPSGETREVADDFDFADLEKVFNTLAAVKPAERPGWVGGGHVERGQLEGAFAWRRLFENQAFILIGVARRFLDGVRHIPFFSPKRETHAGSGLPAAFAMTSGAPRPGWPGFARQLPRTARSPAAKSFP